VCLCACDQPAIHTVRALVRTATALSRVTSADLTRSQSLAELMEPAPVSPQCYFSHVYTKLPTLFLVNQICTETCLVRQLTQVYV